MVHTTWGDWFVTEEVEGDDPEGVSVWYLGCNGFVVRSSETTVYIDPYFADGDPPNLVRMIPVPMDPADASLCDAVLVTHEHVDHMHPPSYGPLLDADEGTLYAPQTAYDRPDYDGDLAVDDDQRAVVAEGDAVTVGDLTVHVREANDPDAIEPVSYVIEHDAGTFFHAGDSRPADAFHDVGEEYDVDLGVLAFGTVGNVYYPEDDEVRETQWYMDENQIIEAASALQLDRLLPSHYDMWRGVTADPKVLHEHAASYPYPHVIDVAAIGDRLTLSEPGVVPARVVR